jgi:hypothetical protein
MPPALDSDAPDGYEATASPATSAATRAAKKSGRRALIGLAAAASVLTVAGSPLANLGAAHLAAAAQPTAAGSLTYRAVADAYVSAATPTHNMGAGSQLVAGTMPGQGAVSYLKFAVSGIPSGRSLSAQLVLHRTSHHLPSSLRVSTASSSWSCGRSRNSRWLRSRNSAVGGSVLMFYSVASFGVEVGRPGRLFGR